MPNARPPSLSPRWQVRDIGSGNFGVAKLMKDKTTGELIAVKFIERGEKVRAAKLPPRLAAVDLAAWMCTWQLPSPLIERQPV